MFSSKGTYPQHLPHECEHCTVWPFCKEPGTMRTHEGNAAVCANCWCYVCQRPVARCSQWQSDAASAPAHCNAFRGSTMWNNWRRIVQWEQRH